MKTKLKAIIFAIFMLAIIGISSKVQAASASIRATKTTATVGDSVTITVNINAAAWNLNVSGNGVSGGKIVGYEPEGNNTSTTRTYSLNTSSAGTYTVSLTGDVTDGATDVNSGINTSVTVNVNNPAPAPEPEPSTPVVPETPSTPSTPSTDNTPNTNNKPTTDNNKPTTNETTPEPEEKKSDDATLKSLVVEGFEIYPEFNSNDKEYNVVVTNDITTVTIVPTVNNSKASYKLEGVPEELQVGKNVITIVVTAEDGTTANYILNVNRQREGLSVTNIKVSYEDENGNIKELTLNPAFAVDVFEYTLEDISHLIYKLNVEVLVNLEDAKIEVTGNELLKEGKNTITITVTMPTESEEEEDEVLKYTITVNKEAKQKVGLIGKISNWFGDNQYKLVMGSLILCCGALVGLSVYLVLDYKRYRIIVEKVAEITRLNTEAVSSKESEVKTVEQQISGNLELDSTQDKNTGRHF